ncbi:hypothetical protein FACS1894158_15470 [Betaproteobacteria bacterium]|nr:hypothetical protein FACS1894158_15470 [Betaproteobacteria bacterium]
MDKEKSIKLFEEKTIRTRFTLDYIGTWEQLYNPNFKLVEFDQFKSEAGANSFVLSPQKWIETTNAIGLISCSGRGVGLIEMTLPDKPKSTAQRYRLTEAGRKMRSPTESVTLR